MELTHENAMKIWNARYGKDLIANDFAGRKMVKSAYNDPMSQYCWTLTQILPLNQGGANIKYNLICCHQLTMSEKSDHFPSFSANGEEYTISRIQNHYEIHLNSKEETITSDNEHGLNLLDVKGVFNTINHLSTRLNNERYCSLIQISFTSQKTLLIEEFIKEVFKGQNVIIERVDSLRKSNITIVDYDLFSKSDVSYLLDKCVLLNTYLTNYFIKTGEIKTYMILFTTKYYAKGQELYLKFDLDELKRLALLPSKSTLYIDEETLINSKASNYKNKLALSTIGNKKFYEYNFIFKKLQENIKELIATQQ